MLFDEEELALGLRGAWRLARFDTGGMDDFTLTLAGFWRSFIAALLVLPGYAILVGEEMVAREADIGFWRIIMVEGGVYVLGWVLFPLVAMLLTRLLDLSHRFVPLIVASNYAAVWQTLAFVVVAAFARFVPGDLSTLALLAVVIAVLTYQWFVTRTALQTQGPTAFGIVMVDLLLSGLLGGTANSLLGLGAAP
ncbi:MAG: hypothetical protein ACFB3T_00960 [Geminicoccaceae bacterium]